MPTSVAVYNSATDSAAITIEVRCLCDWQATSPQPTGRLPPSAMHNCSPATAAVSLGCN